MTQLLVTTGIAEVRAILGDIGYPETPATPQAQSEAQTGTEAASADDGRIARATPLSRPPASPDLLARMLGLNGAVAVGDFLDHGLRLQRTTWQEAERARHTLLSHTLGKRHVAIRRRVTRRYAQAFAGMRPLPDAAAMWTAIQQEYVLPERKPGDIRRCAQKVGARYRELFGATIAVIRRELAWLRDDVRGQLAHISGEGDALMALDASLSPALERAATGVYRRLDVAMAERFYAGFAAAVAGLPGEPEAADLSPWFERRGWVTRFLADGRALNQAILDVEWSGLRGLVDGACGPLPASREIEAK